MTDYRKEFLNNPNINPETGRTITINGTTFKKLVKKYGVPITPDSKLANDPQKPSKHRRVHTKTTNRTNNVVTLEENKSVDTNILLMSPDIDTLINLCFSCKNRFSKLLADECLLAQLKIKFSIPNTVNIYNFTQLINIVSGIPPPKYDQGSDIESGQFPYEKDQLPFKLRWKHWRKYMWLAKLELIEKYSTNVLTSYNKNTIACCFCPKVQYSDKNNTISWTSNTVFAIDNHYMTPSKIFYDFVNTEYIELSCEQKEKITELWSFKLFHKKES
jgi:hypothetical protein